MNKNDQKFKEISKKDNYNKLLELKKHFEENNKTESEDYKKVVDLINRIDRLNQSSRSKGFVESDALYKQSKKVNKEVLSNINSNVQEKEIIDQTPEKDTEVIDKTPKKDDEIIDITPEEFIEDMYQIPKAEKNIIRQLPELNLEINKSSGMCELIEIQGEDEKVSITRMESSNYTFFNLRDFRNEINDSYPVADTEIKYLKSVDPTIYKAYENWENEQIKKGMKFECKKPTEMYIDAVIAREKNPESYVRMPGYIEADIGFGAGRNRENGFQLKNILKSFRANKILKHQGLKGAHSKNKLDLVDIIDNRKYVGAFVGFAALLGISVNVKSLQSGLENIIEENNEVSFQKDDNSQKKEKGKKFADGIKVDTENDKIVKSKNNYQKLQLGEPVTIKDSIMVYSSSSGKGRRVDGALTSNSKKQGINKIAVVIGNKTYTTKDYSADELYKMAKKNPDAKVKYHVGNVKEINGKSYVETMEKTSDGKVQLVYIRNDKGNPKTSDNKEWHGDVKSGTGWIDAEGVTKSNNKNKTMELAER